ncbi:MAG: MFS transporter [Acidimicrobiia bacterium]
MAEARTPRSSLGRQVASPIAITILAVLPAFLVGALAVEIRAELEFSDLRLGALVTIFAVTGFLASPLAGRLIDAKGEKAGAVASSTLVAGGLAVAMLSQSWTALAVAYVIAGLGSAAANPTANLALVTRVPPARQGLAFGLKQAAIPIAIFLAGVAVPAVGLTVGWRWAFAGGAVAALSLAINAARSSPVTGRREASARRGTGDPVPLLLVAGVGFLAIAGVQAVATFLVVAAVDLGIGSGAAGFLLAAASLVGIAVRIGSGWMVDRVPGRSVLLIIASYMAIGAVGLALIAFAEVFVAFGLGTLLGLGAGWSWNGMMHFVVVRGYPEAPASATSILQTGLLAGAASGPLLFGWIVTNGEFRSAWLVAGAALLMAAVLATVAWRVWLPRQIAADEQRQAAAVSSSSRPSS